MAGWAALNFPFFFWSCPHPLLPACSHMLLNWLVNAAIHKLYNWSAPWWHSVLHCSSPWPYSFWIDGICSGQRSANGVYTLFHTHAQANAGILHQSAVSSYSHIGWYAKTSLDANPERSPKLFEVDHSRKFCSWCFCCQCYCEALSAQMVFMRMDFSLFLLCISKQHMVWSMLTRVVCWQLWRLCAA